MWVLVVESSPLEEQPPLLTTKLSLHPIGGVLLYDTATGGAEKSTNDLVAPPPPKQGMRGGPGSESLGTATSRGRSPF